jgi:hypothetical protein
MNPANDWFALLALAFILGAKHGLDADHLATIDGLTRYNQCRAPARARWCGSLFSLGHGAIVMCVALFVGLAAAQWRVPAWMEDVGTWTSIGFLTLLGLLNLRAVLAAPADAMVAPVGLKAGLLRRLQCTSPRDCKLYYVQLPGSLGCTQHLSASISRQYRQIQRRDTLAGAERATCPGKICLTASAKFSLHAALPVVGLLAVTGRRKKRIDQHAQGA